MTTTTTQTPTFAPTQRLARELPKASDFAPLDRKPNTSGNFRRGARRKTSRATRIIL